MTHRYCKCGAILSRFNSSRICGPCTRTHVDAEMFTRRGTSAAAVTHVYTHPSNYPNAHAYLEALTKVLNALCRAHGVAFPTDMAQAFERGAAYGLANGASTSLNSLGERHDPSGEVRAGRSSDLSEVAS